MTRIPKVDKAELFQTYWNIAAPLALGEPEREFHFDKHLGRKHCFDFAWPSCKVAVEVDGGQWAPRGGRHATDKDREKLNIAASLGWKVFRFSPEQLNREPYTCVQLVVDALEALP